MLLLILAHSDASRSSQIGSLPHHTMSEITMAGKAVKNVKREESMRSEKETTGTNVQKTILVVVFQDGIRELLTFCLDYAGYVCLVAEVNLNDPLTWIEESTGLLPDGIILDIDGSSLELREPLGFFRAFCTQWKSLSGSAQMSPLVLLTTQLECFDALQREYTVVMKPFKTPQLLSALETVLGDGREENQ